MAKYVVKPRGVIILKCDRCKTMYAPEIQKNGMYYVNGRMADFEPCPMCGYENNRWRDVIPLWKYNLIKFFRGGFRNGKADDSGTAD